MTDYDYPDDPLPEVRLKREALFALFAQRRYDEAADRALTLDRNVTIFSPLEEIADRIRLRRPADAHKLYTAALANAWEYAGWATGGGEGLSRMGAVRQLEAKLSPERQPPARPKANTQKTDAGRVDAVYFSSVEEALTFLSHQLRQEDIEKLFRICVAPVEKAVFASAVRQLKALDQKTSLSSLYGKQVFPSKRSTFKIGGHSARFGHIHIDFIKTNRRWALQNIASCCDRGRSPSGT